MLTRAVKKPYTPEVDTIEPIQKPNLVHHLVHKDPQFGLRRDPESSASFQEPQANWMPDKIGHSPELNLTAFAVLFVSASLKIAIYDKWAK